MPRFIFWSRAFIITSLVLAFALGGLVTAAHAQDPIPTTHTVQSGENLYRIALRYGFTLDELARANNISNPDRILVGQVLTLPNAIGGGDEALAPAPQAAITQNEPAAAAPLPATTQHIVQANEGLANIAQNYGVRWPDIAAANNIYAPYIIYAGQVLTIPAPTLNPPADYGQAPVALGVERSILIELGQQRITAYENGVAVRQVIVSTGLPATPTVTGDFAVYSKLPSQHMSGPGYYLPDVPWVMYFYQGYAIHGTYWHSNFGSRMSHGCVNLPTAEAQWFYEFAQVGTPVRVVH